MKRFLIVAALVAMLGGFGLGVANGSPQIVSPAGISVERYDCETPTDWALTCSTGIGKLVVNTVKDVFPFKSYTGAFDVLSGKFWSQLDFAGFGANVLGVYLQSGVSLTAAVNDVAACFCHQVKVD